jgi:hypothetical protein
VVGADLGPLDGQLGQRTGIRHAAVLDRDCAVGRERPVGDEPAGEQGAQGGGFGQVGHDSPVGRAAVDSLPRVMCTS